MSAHSTPRRRRLRIAFVLMLGTSIAAAALLGATAAQWKFQLPTTKPYTKLGGGQIRDIAFDSRVLDVRWLTVPPNPRIGDIIVFTRSEDVPTLEFGERWAAADTALRGTWFGFKNLDGNSWLLRCDLRLLRSVLAALLVLLLWGAWRTRSCWPRGSCPRCRYDRAGLASATVCPECGAPPARPDSRRSQSITLPR